MVEDDSRHLNLSLLEIELDGRIGLKKKKVANEDLKTKKIKQLISNQVKAKKNRLLKPKKRTERQIYTKILYDQGPNIQIL